MNNPQPLPYQLLIFDWDGTLMDSIARIVDCLKKAGEQVLAQNNREHDELKDVIGLGLREALIQLHPTSNEKQIEDMSTIYRHQYMNINATPSSLFSGTKNTLSKLRNQGYILAIATGKSRQGLDQTLEITNTSSYFQLTRCASETLSKPDPLMLNEILEQLNLNASDAVMIGDTEYDMAMAKNACMDRIGVNYGVHPETRLLKYDPIGCLDNIQQLNHFLQQL